MMPDRFFLGVGSGENLNEHIVGDGWPALSVRQEMLEGELTVCWARDEAQARRTAHAVWPTAALPTPVNSELPLPSHFEAAATLIAEDQVAWEIVRGPDARRHVQQIEAYVKAGIEHVCVHRVGPDQEGFVRFHQREVLPEVRKLRAAA